MPFPPLNFCSKCGARLALRVPPGDSLPRHVCDNCGTIHYRNPLVVVGTIPEWEDQVLLCKRAIEPRYGLGEVFALLSVPHVDQVHIFYRARLLDQDFAAGEETLEVGLFRQGEIPWKEIAFRTISETLRHFYADRKAGAFGFHAGEILPPK